MLFGGPLVPSDVQVMVYVPGVTRKDEGALMVQQEVAGSGSVCGTSYDPATRRVVPSKGLWLPSAEGEKLLSSFVKTLYDLKEAFTLAKSTPEEPPKEKGAFSLDDVRRFLRSSTFGPAGKAHTVVVRGDVWDVDPVYRERLDHYGNDGDGWDDEGWQSEYSEPVYVDTVSKLEQRFGKGYFFVDVGEKGHINVSLTPKGKENIR